MIDLSDVAYFLGIVVLPVVIAATAIGVALIVSLSLFSALAQILER